jgi:serine/threonine-protein kinase
MARQQVVNFKCAKPDVDIWAMAASLYCMLTGCIPRNFPRGKDPWQTVLNTDPVPIRDRDSSIPRKLAEVIDLALRDRKGLHFKTAAQFKKALMEVL